MSPAGGCCAISWELKVQASKLTWLSGSYFEGVATCKSRGGGLCVQGFGSGLPFKQVVGLRGSLGLAASVHSGAAASAGWVGLHMLCRHGPVIGVPAMQACPCTAASCYAEWHGPIQCSGTLHAGCAMSPSLACIPQAYICTYRVAVGSA